jgi:hypothetical protein
MKWVSTVDGRIDVEITSIVPQAAGNNTAYQAQVVTRIPLFLPFVTN